MVTYILIGHELFYDTIAFTKEEKKEIKKYIDREKKRKKERVSLGFCF